MRHFSSLAIVLRNEWTPTKSGLPTRSLIILLFFAMAVTGCSRSGGGHAIGAASPVLSSIRISPANPVVSIGGTQQFTVTGTYSDTSTRDLSSSATWTCLDHAVAGINDAGFATAAGPGSATIQATVEDKQASALIGVVTGKPEINVNHLALGKQFGDILKLFNPVIDAANRKLYVVGSKTTNVGVVDLDTDELVETFDIGVLGGFLIFDSNTLYSYDFGANKCYRIDTTSKNAAEISLTTCQSVVPHDRGVPKNWGAYSFLETGYQSFSDGTTGFPTDWRQDLHGAYGVIEIHDASHVKKGELIHGPDALYFIIDQATGKLYTTNTGDGSISIFDLNKLETTNFCQNNSCQIDYIDIGNSADQVISDASGTLYVRNRLGGSVVYKYVPDSETFSVINNEDHEAGGIALWPTGMALSSDEKKLYLLSHYGALINVIDTATNTVTNTIQFTTDLKPRTDSISAMQVDRSRNRLYVVWPELGIIGVADGNNNTVLGTIDLTLYGFDRSKADNAGPGLVTLEVSEQNNKLYAYLKNEQKTLIFNGDTLAKVDETGISKIVVNDGKNVLYAGPRILDPVTYAEKGTFSKGQAVIGFDNSRNAVYLYEMVSAGGKKQEKLYEFVNNTVAREWTFDAILSIGSSFHFDFARKAFYVAYFETGTVKIYPL